jgi:hypothetical protein
MAGLREPVLHQGRGRRDRDQRQGGRAPEDPEQDQRGVASR